MASNPEADRVIVRTNRRASNGRSEPRPLNPNKWQEIGTAGLEANFGYFSEAYLSKLTWPSVYPIYNRIRRSDTEITIIRQLFAALISQVQLRWEIDWDDPTDDDKRARDFADTILDDLEDGIDGWLDTAVNYVPFMGWGWWEIVPGLRRDGWRPPGGPDDPWVSSYDDGLLGIRRLAWRDHSSFQGWDMDEYTGRVFGMEQQDPPNRPVIIPKAKSVHLTFGDPVNPEGLSPLEAVYRLERIKYGLEVVQGIGFEHSAGYLDVKSSKDQITNNDKAKIKAAARSILSAQEGNYALWPKGFEGELSASSFDAASAIAEAIRYYGILKLQVYNMQWVALSSTTGTGSFAAKKEDTTMFVLYFNAMVQKFAKQLGEQLSAWIFDRNAGQWPNLTRHPKLKIVPIQKMVSLDELTPFIQALSRAGFFEIGEDDILWMRRQAGMPETIPTDEDDVDEPGDSGASVDDDEQEVEDEIDEGDVVGAMARFQDWAADHAPWINRVMDRPVRSGDERDDG